MECGDVLNAVILVTLPRASGMCRSPRIVGVTTGRVVTGKDSGDLDRQFQTCSVDTSNPKTVKNDQPR